MFPDNAPITTITDQTLIDLEDKATVLRLKSRIYYGLNDRGAYVWRLIEQPKRVGDLRATILAAYDVTPEQRQQNLHCLLRDLHWHDQIAVRDADHGVAGA